MFKVERLPSKFKTGYIYNDPYSVLKSEKKNIYTNIEHNNVASHVYLDCASQSDYVAINWSMLLYSC